MRVETKTFHSPDFPFDREIFICTPQYYDQFDQSEVDVVYVFDSQWRSHFALTYAILAECQDPYEEDVPFIVVGITSPTTPDYHRNNDFLPVPTNVTYQSKYYGNYENFKKFIREDVMPYINSNYRTSGHTLAIGHSFGASFILNALASEELFDDYIALSPNFGEDNNLFADNFLGYDFNNSKPRFLFLTMSNESEETGWPAAWRPAWDLVKSTMQSRTLPENINIFFKEYPEHTHMSGYAQCLMDILPIYGTYRRNTQFTDSVKYPVHIELECPWAEGDVFITGNQDAIVNWNPQGVKMNKIDDKTFAIDLNLQLPAEFKFTQGSWETLITPGNAYPLNLRIYEPGRTTKHYVAQ
ncbi:MAG: alpha/beta hydrolase-fold protein [Odoribacter sp.]|nr:alpha/beta hydrolase-fold protein [Odoribacter sp.]